MAAFNEEMVTNPLISYILFSYNQESFISDALESALAQTYSPLEIIISDDCSSDNTYKIIQSVLSTYTGPHKVIVNCNRNNLGVSKHFNKIVNLAKGEILVFSAGDDISKSNRAESIFMKWKASSFTTAAFFSNLERIDLNGKPHGLLFDGRPDFASTLDEFKSGKPCWTIGASFAAHRSVFNGFAPIRPEVLQEDGCCAFRALLKGNIEYIDDILVKYRFHEGSISQHDDPAKRLNLQRSQYFMKLVWLDDAKLYAAEDRQLIRFLRYELIIAYAKQSFFKMPLLGFTYNLLRINGRKFFRK